MSELTDFIRDFNTLKEKVNNLIFPEVIGAWIDWTPTIAQGVAVTSTVPYAKYKRMGSDLIAIRGQLAVTSAGTGGSAISISGLPTSIQPASPSNLNVVGVGFIRNTGTADYFGAMLATGANDIRFRINNSFLDIGADPNFALASGDAISFSGLWHL